MSFPTRGVLRLQIDQDHATETDLTDAQDVIDPDQENEITGTEVATEIVKGNGKKKGWLSSVQYLFNIRMCTCRERVTSPVCFVLITIGITPICTLETDPVVVIATEIVNESTGIGVARTGECLPYCRANSLICRLRALRLYDIGSDR